MSQEFGGVSKNSKKSHCFGAGSETSSVGAFSSLGDRPAGVSSVVRATSHSHEGLKNMTAEIRSLCDEDMIQLARRLRPMDRLEVVSVVPDAPLEEVLLTSGRSSVRSRAGFWNGQLVACWGVVPRDRSTEGAPWLLATDTIDDPDVRRAFVRHGAKEMRRLTAGFSHLWNFVHRDNGTARRWLRFMGFEFRDPREYVLSGEPFVRFEMERS